MMLAEFQKWVSVGTWLLKNGAHVTKCGFNGNFEWQVIFSQPLQNLELINHVQGVKILSYPIFFSGKVLFCPFFGKCPILSYFLAILPLILSELFHVQTLLKIF